MATPRTAVVQFNGERQMRRYRGWVWAIGGLVATTAVIAGAARTAQLIAFRQWGPTGDLPLELLEPVLPFALVMAALAVSATATVVVLLRAGATVGRSERGCSVIT